MQSSASLSDDDDVWEWSSERRLVSLNTTSRWIKQLWSGFCFLEPSFESLLNQQQKDRKQIIIFILQTVQLSWERHQPAVTTQQDNFCLGICVSVTLVIFKTENIQQKTQILKNFSFKVLQIVSRRQSTDLEEEEEASFRRPRGPKQQISTDAQRVWYQFGGALTPRNVSGWRKRVSVVHRTDLQSIVTIHRFPTRPQQQISERRLRWS